MKIKLENKKAIVRFKNQDEKILFTQLMFDMQSKLEDYDVKIRGEDGLILKRRKIISKDVIKNKDDLE